MTYVRLKHHDKVASKIINITKGQDIQKWNLQVRRLVRRLRSKDNHEADYLDIDMILGMMIDTYKMQRKLYQQDLKRTFTRMLEGSQEKCEVDKFQEIVKSCIPRELESDI